MSRLVVEHDSVETNGGRADVTNWDFSYADENRVRLTLDDLFVVEVKLPEQFAATSFIGLPIRIISSEVDEACCYNRIYFDQFDCDYIRRSIWENLQKEEVAGEKENKEWEQINDQAIDVFVEWLDVDELTEEEEAGLFNMMRELKQKRFDIWNKVEHL